MSTPSITIFVRHGGDCKQVNELYRKCDCRKHLRWSHNGTQHRKKAGTRDWSEAEKVKREMEDQLSGRPVEKTGEAPKTLEDAVTVFLQDKAVQGVNAHVLAAYKRETDRLRVYCERQGVFTVGSITREVLTGFCATWDALYASSATRAKVKERLSGFLRFCFQAEWLARIPALPRINVDEPPTLPLSADEYTRLLVAIPQAISRVADRAPARALIQLMRWSGLAIRDAVTLRRDEIIFDGKLHRVVTQRQKTGVHVSVPLPPAIAAEILAVTNTNAVYIFWDGVRDAQAFAGNWGTKWIGPVFDAAGIPRVCTMVSHRLRDTFAVDLLQKGVPLEEVSKLLGHESIRTTEKHYARWVQGRQDRLDSLVTGTWTWAA